MEVNGDVADAGKNKKKTRKDSATLHNCRGTIAAQEIVFLQEKYSLQEKSIHCLRVLSGQRRPPPIFLGAVAHKYWTAGTAWISLRTYQDSLLLIAG